MLGKLKCPQTTILGAKHISKSKCTKHLMLGKLFEVKMSKKCTALWREAHFQVKTRKTHHAGSTFGSWDVEKAHGVAARSTFRSQNIKKTPFLEHYWKLRCAKSARRYAVVARSTFRTTFGRWDVAKVHAVGKSKALKIKTVSDHFWRFRCGKSARRCDAKHICKSKW